MLPEQLWLISPGLSPLGQLEAAGPWWVVLGRCGFENLEWDLLHSCLCGILLQVCVALRFAQLLRTGRRFKK